MNQEDFEFQIRVLRPKRGDLLVFEREDTEWLEDEVLAIAEETPVAAVDAEDDW